MREILPVTKIQSMSLSALGEPLQLETVEIPEPSTHEVQIETLACSVNFADTLIVVGKYQEKPDLPFAPGMEVVGRIVNPGTSDLKRGQIIASYIGFGGMAERVNVSIVNCIPLPDGSDPVTCAAVPIAYGTSHLALSRRAKLQKGETLLVLGASGGVGLTAVELGAAMGAKVIAAARGPEKLAVAASKGAHHLIDTETDDIREKTLALGGADVVYDPVGGDQFKAALRSCNPEARVLPLGFASGEVPSIPANIILVKNISVLGFYWGGYQKFAPKVLADSLAELMDMLKNGQITPHISHVLPLAQANQALDLLRTRKATGKVVIDFTRKE